MVYTFTVNGTACSRLVTEFRAFKGYNKANGAYTYRTYDIILNSNLTRFFYFAVFYLKFYLNFCRFLFKRVFKI